jgi:hypothetical protein
MISSALQIVGVSNARSLKSKSLMLLSQQFRLKLVLGCCRNPERSENERSWIVYTCASEGRMTANQDLRAIFLVLCDAPQSQNKAKYGQIYISLLSRWKKNPLVGEDVLSATGNL